MLNQFKTGNFDWLLKDYGPKFAGDHPRNAVESPREKTGNFFKDVNTAALDNLAAWVPIIFPTAKFQKGTQAYRVDSPDLGRDLEEDLSLHPDGIRDFGEETGRTPIDVVIEYGGASTPQEAAFMLLGCLGISPESMGWNAMAAPGSYPTQDQRKWPEPLGQDAFHGLAGEVVRAIAPQSEADEAALMIQCLVAFGNIIGRSAYYKVEGTRHYTNLFAVLVGQSSKSRKGTSWDRIAEMFEGISDDWLNKCTHGGMSSGEGLVYPVRNATTKSVADKKTKEITTVIDDPGSDEKRLLVQESEFAGALRVMRREGNTLSRVVRDAWDRYVLEFMTKNSRIRAEGAHISIVGHITTEELKRELTATDMANGFANRFLFSCAKRSKELPMGGARSAEMIAAAEKVKSVVETRRNKQMFLSDDDLDGASGNGELTWSADARDLWCEIYAELSAGKPGMFGSVTARAEAQVVRLSLIYAVLDNASAIEVVHLRAGLAVWRYSEASAAYIWGDSLGDSAADTVLQALRAAGTAGMTRTNISALFDRHKGSQDLARVLNLLLERKLARMEMRATAGRSEEVWRAI